jgi:formylglycine-generating enzyme required for sulfatase activity
MEVFMKKYKIWCMLLIVVLFSAFIGCDNPSVSEEGSPVTVLTAGDRQTVTAGDVTFALRYVPGTGDSGFQRDSAAANISIITNSYWMGETEVTQGLFEAVMGADVKPSHFTANPEDTGSDGWKTLPVEYVNWYGAIAFCNKLSLLTGKTPVYSVTFKSTGLESTGLESTGLEQDEPEQDESGWTELDWAGLVYSSIPTGADTDWNNAKINEEATGYRLPTEMEWMWAAMGATEGGSTRTGYSKDFVGDNESGTIDEYAWYVDNAVNKTHEVGTGKANELKIKDMSGNVYEWCWDGNGPYPAGAQTDYLGAASVTPRVIRGGSYNVNAANCTVAMRNSRDPSVRNYYVGFRVILPH